MKRVVVCLICIISVLAFVSWEYAVDSFYEQVGVWSWGQHSEYVALGLKAFGGIAAIIGAAFLAGLVLLEKVTDNDDVDNEDEV